MTSHRLHQRLLALTLPAGYFLTPMVASAQSTWNGTTNSDWATASNWSAGVPAGGANITIADTTGGANTLNLDSARSIGALSYGAAGARITAFTLNTLAANNLTIGGGVTATGTWAGGATAFAMRGHYTISNPQNFAVGGSAAHATDQGVQFREITATTVKGSLTLNSNLTKTGVGQLMLTGIDVTGTGDLIVDTGNLKLNAGSTLPLVIAGPGNLTVNNSAILAVYKNSGTMVITRPISFNGTSSLVAVGSPVDIASTIAFNGTHTLSAGGTTNLTGAISGTGAVTRSGGGALTLSGANSGYTGIFTNTAGTLNITNTFGGDLQVNAGTLGGEGTVSGNATLATSTLNVLPATAGSLHVATDLTLSGTVTVGMQGAVPTGTPFKVISYGGSLTGDETNFTLAGGATAYRGFTFTNNTGAKSIDLSVTAGAVTWTGAVSATWDINTTANWSGTSDKYFQLDAVTFPNVASNKVVTLNSTVTPGSITFENELSSDYSISGTGLISGVTSITKNGTGVTVLGGANGQNYTGPIAVNAGILRMGSRDAFGQTSGITIASGGQVDINAQAPGGIATGGYTYTIAGTGPSPANAGALVNTGASSASNAGVKNLVLSANATLGGTGRFDIGSANVAGFGTITGNGHTLTVKNTSQVGFRGDASGSPINIVVDAGAIWAEDNDNGLGGATGTVTVNTGAKAGTFGTRSVVTPVTLNTGGTLHNQGGGTGTWTGTITLAGDTTAIEANGQAVVISGTLTESGGSRTLTKTGNNTLTLTSASGHTGNTVLTNGFLQLGNGGTSGSINGNPVDIASATSGLIINRSDDVTVSNVISGTGPAANASNPGAVSKLGTGTLTLTGANTYSGLTRFGTGTIAIGSNETVFGTGLLDFRGGGIRSSDATPRTIDNPISYSNPTTFGSPGTGNLLFTGTVATGGGAKTFTVNNAVTEFSGVLSGTASTSTLTKDGPGTLIFSNDNFYLQTTTISEGIMQVGNGGITGNLSSTAVINNAALVINRSLDVGVTEFTFNNVISGTGTLTHSGPALTVLGGANTYTGNTIITNGVLSHTLPNFADTSSIQISGPGKLDLFHPETDTVNTLVINGTPQAVGVYGAVGSGAPIETAFITGVGRLNVTSDGSTTPYSSWATDKGLTAGNNGTTDNPDFDGYDNLTEFATDGDPLSGKTGGKIVVKVASVGGQQALTLTLPVRTAVGAFAGATALSATGDGVTYTIEGSDNLAASSWTLDIDEVTGPDATAIQTGLPALSGAGWVYRTFRTPGAVTGDPTDFIRARVE